MVRCDLTQPFTHGIFGPNAATPDYILNIASESHVDRSLEDPTPFVRNNVELILNVMEYAREVQPSLVLHMSTDEVFGNARDNEYHQEWDAIRPSNPYSASKAAQEAIAYSYWRAFGVPLIITNTMNLISPASVTFQSSEKFVPMIVKRLLADEEVAIHVDDQGQPGSRCWIDVRDFAAAWLFLINRFEDDSNRTYYPNQPHTPLRFNIVGEEQSNRWIAETLAEKLGIDDPKLVDVNFHGSRPGHDPRYALDDTRLYELGWSGPRPLDQTLDAIVVDYQNHEEFLED
jgi:dTDP-glucose 4,6-dehydratase